MKKWKYEEKYNTYVLIDNKKAIAYFTYVADNFITLWN